MWLKRNIFREINDIEGTKRLFFYEIYESKKSALINSFCNVKKTLFSYVEFPTFKMPWKNNPTSLKGPVHGTRLSVWRDKEEEKADNYRW